MSGTIPARPKIYHITHVNNLARIIESGMIWSDAKRLEHAFECETIGISGFAGGKLKELVKHHVHIKSDHMGLIEDAQMIAREYIAARDNLVARHSSSGG